MIILEKSYGIIPLHSENGIIKVFVILHKKGNHWSFPKGHPNNGENPLQSAIRELKEETGLIVEKILSEQPLIESYTFYRENKKIHKEAHYFPAFVKGEPVLQEEEIQDGKWVTFEEASKILTYKEAKDICKKVKTFTTTFF